MEMKERKIHDMGKKEKVKEKTITVTIAITVEISKELLVERLEHEIMREFVQEMDYDFKSQTEGVKVLYALYTNFLDVDF